MAAAASKPVEHTVRRGAVRGRPSLGDREHVTAALWPSLEALVDDLRGGLNRSPFLADLLAWHIGRPELIRHSQLAMEFTTRGAAAFDAAKPSGTKTRHCTVRVHPDVARELDRGASESGLPRAVFIADAIAESLGVSRAHATAKEEGLPLAM
ncbi:hypothetical protein [Mycolicibacterium neoaurum]|uniref:hypothetical protein n=1 Tax=Mycolicibacterium neoaurum TaxID=1795 RepID=UPI001F4CE025|nr:hypothetical protein [Mycolicibacterium neoaurum]